MIQKQGVDVSFAQGLDTKTDPKRVQMGKFVRLVNSVFDVGGELKKRNGYAKLSSLPDTTYSYLTTFNGNLTAIGPDIAAYNDSNASWVAKGMIEPLSLSTLPLIRNNLNQTAADSVVAPNGTVCTVYLESDGTSTFNKYVIADAVTGQNISAPALIPVASGTVSGGMRVFVLGNNFVIVFTNTIAGSPHLQYVTVACNNPTLVGPNTDIASGYTPASTLSWDGYVVNSSLYVAYNTTSGGQSVQIVRLSTSLVQYGPTVFAGAVATMVSVTADATNPTSPIIYINYWASPTGHTAAVDQNLNVVLAPVTSIPTVVLLNLTSAAQNGVCTLFAEVENFYLFDPTLPTNYVEKVTVTQAGTVAAPIISVRSVGLASKAFIIEGAIYYLSVYASPYQTTYFLINGSESTQDAPVIAAKVAYGNGGGYLTMGLPSAVTDGDTTHIAYRIKDLIAAVNKDTDVPTGTQVNGIYSQTGINLSNFEFGTEGLDTSEIATDLHITGGLLWMYDGYLPVEHNFLLWPDTDQDLPTATATWAATGGSIAAQPDGATNVDTYYVQFTYEWTDNQGNAFRSAPSIPIAVTTTGSGNTGIITYNIPTLRLTMKTANPVKIVAYRWSVGQQIYYQTTSITAPLLNQTAIDYLTFTDTSSDAMILGNNILYTTGGVVEDVAAPASNILSLFDTRLWLVSSEDPNLLWYSKQVIEATPVEMSDLFTIYIPPTTSTEGTTGPITALAAMDDKLIIFKENAILYISGTGPDNTGANNQFSPPVFITSTVGCTNQKSIVLTPTGLMFQSNKGIWLLDRGMNSNYIGAPVEEFNASLVNSAVNVPATNQVRFTLSSGQTLMYDYFYAQWGTFEGVPAISSCVFEGMHTFINSYGAVYQEEIGNYLDGSNPVLMSFKTGPLRLGELQHYQRAYFFYLLGTFISPHKLQMLLYYDYADSPSQSTIISPTNYSTPYGSGPSQSPYGQGTPYGGGSSLESWRIFLERQRCMAFAIEIKEIFDPSYGTVAGAGLTLSGLNVVMGFKQQWRPQIAANSAG